MASFKLHADVITKNPKEIEKILAGLIGLDGMMRTENGFRVIKVLEGRSAI